MFDQEVLVHFSPITVEEMELMLSSVKYLTHRTTQPAQGCFLLILHVYCKHLWFFFKLQRWKLHPADGPEAERTDGEQDVMTSSELEYKDSPL